MKLSRLLATITICSALVASGAEANAKSKRHSSKSMHSGKSSKAKKHQAAKPADESDSSDANLTAVEDPSAAEAAPPAPAAPAEAPSTTTTTTTTKTAPAETPEPAPSDTTVTPMAEPAPETVPPPATTSTTTTTTEKTVVFLPMVSSSERAEHGYTPTLGLAISAGGGAFSFVGGVIKNQTDTGGSWTVRALIGSRSIVGLEAAYIGSAQSINALGLSNDATLLGNGVTGNLRLNAPLAVKKFLVEPYGFVGAGWSHYSINRSNTISADFKTTDDVILMPVGGGLAFGYAGFFVDARYEYRFSFDNDLVVVPAAGVNRGQDNWTAGGTVGFEF